MIQKKMEEREQNQNDRIPGTYLEKHQSAHKISKIKQ